MTAETGLPMAAPSFVRKSIRYTGSMWILIRKSKSRRSVQALAWCGLQGFGRSLTKRSKNPTTAEPCDSGPLREQVNHQQGSFTYFGEMHQSELMKNN